MKTNFFKSIAMLCLTIVCAFSSQAQLNSGSIPTNRSAQLLAQRFQGLHVSEGEFDVIFGTPDLNGRNNSSDYEIDNEAEIRFTITYNPNGDEFTNQTETYRGNRREERETGRIGNLRNFVGNSKRSNLANMNYLQIDMGNGNPPGQRGQIIIDQLVLNGQSIRETYTLNPRDNRSVYLLDANLAAGYTLSGRVRMVGTFHNNSRPNNFIQFTTGYYYDFTTLPLEFTSIKGFAENSQNRITFTTADNHEGKTFFIERSADGKQYESIGQVAVVAGRTGQYTFIDKQPLSNGFYRVRGVNILDRMVYSDVIRINQSLSTMRVINQVGRTELVFSESAERSVSVYTFSGQLVKKLNFNSNRHSFDHQGLQKGMYVMQVNGEAIKLMVL
ncbi:T9SS type A sorting domain-containing protein [Flavihumibacter sp. CACIAM 22H1]|uniref:T9SS type A sorting domain-containing protein n=1 Tax=Flavihumibacter sp. CACIAM 22H1 TaxID=1812911 RepID=UPI000B17966B|nr:T9SS type A sorting domain-containing protein [Flavihumibacter sp. CACIAM 22H1]